MNHKMADMGVPLEKRMSLQVLPAMPFTYVDKMATKGRLATLGSEHPLPELKWPVWVYRIRYEWLSMYRRLFILTLVANIAAMATIIARISRKPDTTSALLFDYHKASTGVAVNTFVAVLLRHEHFVNFLFHSVMAIPHSSPLWLRRYAAKIYCYGGLHSACAISALAWHVFFVALFSIQLKETALLDVKIIVHIINGIAIGLFSIMIVLSHPTLRMKIHDTWEMVHRFFGWTLIGLIWTQVFLLVTLEVGDIHPETSFTSQFGKTLAQTPAFWFLLATTCLLLYPWIRLRKRSVAVEPLSNHAVRLHFKHSNAPVGGAVRIAEDPLLETHAFATIPDPNKKGFSVIMSNNGDFTKRYINSSNRSSRIWMKGQPQLGVLHISLMFRPVVIVATGSGIGPCLSLLENRPDWPVRVVWSTRDPILTYGYSVIDAVLKADRNAVIIDTTATGYPDMSTIVYSQYKQSGAEAIVIISNPKVTYKVVHDLEKRNVPAYGAIFDS